MINKLKQLFGIERKAAAGVISKKEIASFLDTQTPIIIEAGASTGVDTYELSKQFPKGTIYAFEPLPEIFEILKEKVRGCSNVHLFQEALSDQAGQANINISSNKSSSSLMQPKEHLDFHPDIKFEESITVKTITIDDFLKREQINKIDFMWLDMQGMEQKTLQASPQTLSKLSLLYTEVSLIETYNEVPLYKDYKMWLESQGFEAIHEELAWEDMGNVLFKKKGI